MISFLRIVTTGFVNFWRNIWLSAAATLVMTITLIILSTLLLVFAITSYSINGIRERVDMSVYFTAGLAENKIFEIRDELKQNSRVTEVTYISPDEGLKEFLEKNKQNSLITDSLGELNENPIPATLRIKTHTLDDFPAVAEQLKADKYKSMVEKVNFEDNRLIIERLNSILNFVKTFGLALVAVFSLIAVLVIFNTITLTIYNRREEIEIMRLVGATNWYIRGPFLMEAVMYSIMATIITSALLFGLYNSVIPKVSKYLGSSDELALSLSGLPHFLLSGKFVNLPVLLLILLGTSILLSIVSTLLSMRKYLRI